MLSTWVDHASKCFAREEPRCRLVYASSGLSQVINGTFICKLNSLDTLCAPIELDIAPPNVCESQCIRRHTLIRNELVYELARVSVGLCNAPPRSRDEALHGSEPLFKQT